MKLNQIPIMIVIFLLSTILYVYLQPNNPEIVFTVEEVEFPQDYELIAKEPPRIRDQTTINLVFNITNAATNPVRLTDTEIISYYGGYEIGRIELTSQLMLAPGSSLVQQVEIAEDWSNFPIKELWMDHQYALKTRASSLLSQKIITKYAYILEDIDRDYPLLVKADEEYLTEFSEHIFPTGLNKDDIKPIDDPDFLPVDNVSEKYRNNDVVYLVETQGSSRIYPRRLMVLHEIVNDEIDGRNVSITYCPLTDSAIGYSLSFGGNSTTFGTSGKLLNSNLVMYDRETGSYWPQILGTSVKGKWRGVEAKLVPIISTRWGLAISEYPNALVLSEEFSYLPHYGADPYRDYIARERIIYPVMNRDARLGPFQKIIGIKTGNSTAALSKNSLVNEKLIFFELGESNFMAVYDPALDTVRLFKSIMNGSHMDIGLVEGFIVDNNTGNKWNLEGEAVNQNNSKMEQVTSFEVLWFGWVAFYPDTKLIMP